jgi:hypothetical protein
MLYLKLKMTINDIHVFENTPDVVERRAAPVA